LQCHSIYLSDMQKILFEIQISFSFNQNWAVRRQFSNFISHYFIQLVWLPLLYHQICFYLIRWLSNRVEVAILFIYLFNYMCYIFFKVVCRKIFYFYQIGCIGQISFKFPGGFFQPINNLVSIELYLESTLNILLNFLLLWFVDRFCSRL
jgi:hypothetical protein